MKLNNYYLNDKINIILNNNNSYISVKGLYGLLFYKMPSYYFYKNTIESIKFLFINKNFYISFINFFFKLLYKLSFLFNINICVKGLGYRIRKITKHFYYFFFNYTNMFYFYLPFNILLKWYKKKIILISNNYLKLKLLFSHILILKNIGTYRLKGLRYTRQIIFIKKGIKKN